MKITDLTIPVKQITHAEMVNKLSKSPEEILKSLTTHDCAIMHATFGISGEAGELLDAVKKVIIYRKPMDRANVVEEMGDLEFYLEDLRQRLGITREETIEANINKLSVRYSNFEYSNQQAQDRADKVEEAMDAAAGIVAALCAPAIAAAGLGGTK